MSNALKKKEPPNMHDPTGNTTYYVHLEMVKSKAFSGTEVIGTPFDAFTFLENQLGLSKQHKESFYTLFLDHKAHINGVYTVAVGTSHSCIVSAQEVFKAALLSNCTSILCAHNHPTGDVKPSASDILVTDELIKAGKLLDIKVVDHIIIGDGNYYSMAENNDCKFYTGRSRTNPKLRRLS